MVTWIDKKLAMAPMPSEDQIKDLSRTFKAVAILVEDWELDYDMELWAEFCAKVKHLPIKRGIQENYFNKERYFGCISKEVVLIALWREKTS